MSLLARERDEDPRFLLTLFNAAVCGIADTLIHASEPSRLLYVAELDASPAALPSRPSSTESLGGAAAGKRHQRQQQRNEKNKDPAVEEYLGELSRLRAEAEKAFSGGGERERAAAA